MQPIKGYLENGVRKFVLPEQEAYESIEYNPSEGCRLFDNQEQAQKRVNAQFPESVEEVEEDTDEDVEETQE